MLAVLPLLMMALIDAAQGAGDDTFTVVDEKGWFDPGENAAAVHEFLETWAGR